MCTILVISIASLLVVSVSPFQVESQFSLLMPNAKPSQPETYLCTTIRLDENTTHYITGFNPQAEMGTAHHMLLFGCEEPGLREPLYSCGEMGIRLLGTKQASPCRSGKQVIHAWAKNTPELTLPKDVGFKVGGHNSGIKFLVLQVHYASIDNIPRSGDKSGVILRYTHHCAREQVCMSWRLGE